MRSFRASTASCSVLGARELIADTDARADIEQSFDNYLSRNHSLFSFWESHKLRKIRLFNMKGLP